MSQRAEAAYRAWGNTNRVIRETVEALDRRVEKILAEAIAELFGDHARAQMLADMALSLAIGAQQRDRPSGSVRVIEMLLEWYRSCLGLDAQVVEVDGAPRLRLRMPIGRSGTDGP